LKRANEQIKAAVGLPILCAIACVSCMLSFMVILLFCRLAEYVLDRFLLRSWMP
jgi:hypothetical protein